VLEPCPALQSGSLHRRVWVEWSPAYTAHVGVLSGQRSLVIVQLEIRALSYFVARAILCGLALFAPDPQSRCAYSLGIDSPHESENYNSCPLV
jgi:hypothetical protein